MVSGVSAAESGATNNVQTATNEPGGIHQVRAGETLSQIAQRYGTDVGTLAALNDIRNPDLIHVGDQLTLPAGAAQGYEVAFGDTLGKIAARHGVGLDALLSGRVTCLDTTEPSETRPTDVAQERLFKIKCPECDGAGTLAFEEGCLKCHACGFSQC